MAATPTAPAQTLAKRTNKGQPRYNCWYCKKVGYVSKKGCNDAQTCHDHAASFGFGDQSATYLMRHELPQALFVSSTGDMIRTVKRLRNGNNNHNTTSQSLTAGQTSLQVNTTSNGGPGSMAASTAATQLPSALLTLGKILHDPGSPDGRITRSGRPLSSRGDQAQDSGAKDFGAQSSMEQPETGLQTTEHASKANRTNHRASAEVSILPGWLNNSASGAGTTQSAEAITSAYVPASEIDCGLEFDNDPFGLAGVDLYALNDHTRTMWYPEWDAKAPMAA